MPARNVIRGPRAGRPAVVAALAAVRLMARPALVLVAVGTVRRRRP